jgi:NADPH:quinone reductase-like Zn-dependent oxidoreductase
MKAIVCHGYGSPADVLRFTDVEDPVVTDDEVLVRVRAASVNPADWHLIRGVPYIARLTVGLRTPSFRVPGCDVAGQVEAVGRNVTTHQPGDEVFASVFLRGFGAFAERVSVSEDLLELKPANLSFDQAAPVPLAGVTALQALRDHGSVEPGHKVLIVGASGGVGTFAVQIAKSLGAEVTGVCGTDNMDMVRSLGADHVIDYTQEDFTEGRQRYDLILQLAGTSSASDCRSALVSKGTLILNSGNSAGRWIGPLDRIIKARALSPFVRQRMVSFTVKPNQQDLQGLKQLIEVGQVTPVIDKTYSLSQVPEALRHLEEGHARGKTVITM